jgi:hypothetical protein
MPCKQRTGEIEARRIAPVLQLAKGMLVYCNKPLKLRL